MILGTDLPCKVESYPDPRGYRLEYMVGTTDINNIQVLAKGFTPQVSKASDMDVSRAMIVRYDYDAQRNMDSPKYKSEQSGKWNPGTIEEEQDGFFDEITGLILTNNSHINTWQDVSGEFKKQLRNNGKIAKENGHDFFSHYDGKTLVIIGRTEKAMKILESFSGKPLTTRLAKRQMGLSLNIVSDIVDSRIKYPGNLV